MPPTTVVALPGLHGSAALFDAFVAARPLHLDLRTIALDDDLATYEDLERDVLQRLPDTPFWIVAESFSGPLAVRIAARRDVLGLVLCASFASFPHASLRFVPWRLVSLAPAPRCAISSFLTGGDSALAARVNDQVRRLSHRVFSDRIRAALSVNVHDLLALSSYPCLYVQATRDRLLGQRGPDTVLAARPDTTVARIDAPHLVLQTAPELAWSVISKFAAQQWLAADRGPDAPRSAVEPPVGGG
jgi:pimeloyl-ACP methyl ester carboxylesterase